MRYPTHIFDIQTSLSPPVPLTNKVLDLSGSTFFASNAYFYDTTTEFEFGAGSFPISAALRVDGNTSTELKNGSAVFSYSNAVIKNIVPSVNVSSGTVIVLNNTIEFTNPSIDIPGSILTTSGGGKLQGIVNGSGPVDVITATIVSVSSNIPTNSWIYTVASVPPQFFEGMDIQIRNMEDAAPGSGYSPFNTSAFIHAKITAIQGNDMYVNYEGSGIIDPPGPPVPSISTNTELYFQFASLSNAFIQLNDQRITIPGGTATPDMSGNPVVVSGSDDSVYFAFLSRYSNNISYSNSMYDIMVGHVYSNGSLHWLHRVSSLVTRLEEATPSLTIGTSNELYITYMTTGETVGNVNGYNIYENTSNYGTVGCSGIPSIVGREDIVLAQLDTSAASPTIQPTVRWKLQNGFINSAYRETNPVVCVDTVNQLVYLAYECNQNIACFSPIGSPNIVLHCFTMKGNHLWVQAESNINSVGQNTSPSISADTSGNVYLAYEITEQVRGGAPPSGQRQIEVVRFQTILNTPSTSNTYTSSTTYTYGNWVYYTPTSSWYQVKVLSVTGIAPESDSSVWSEPYSANVLYSGRSWVLSQDINIFTIDGVPGDESSQPTIIAHQNGNVFLGFRTTGRISDDYEKTTPPGGHDLVVVSFTRDLRVRWIHQGYMYNPEAIRYIDCESPNMTMDAYGNLLLSLKTTIATPAEYQNAAVFHFDQDGHTLWEYPRTETETYPVYMYARSQAPHAVFSDISMECTFSKVGVSKRYNYTYVATVTDVIAPGQTQIGATTCDPTAIKTLCISAFGENVYYGDRNAFAYMTTTRGICQCSTNDCGCF